MTIRRSAQGFTLVELMIVMVIVAMVAAIAVPRFSQASARQQLSSAADRVVADLEMARTRARAASQTVTVTFSTSSDRYQFNNVGGEASVVELGESPYNVSIDRAVFGSNDNIASFNGYGVPASSGAVTLSLGADQVVVELKANGEVRR